jgi:hypothetical protein
MGPRATIALSHRFFRAVNGKNVVVHDACSPARVEDRLVGSEY